MTEVLRPPSLMYFALIATLVAFVALPAPALAGAPVARVSPDVVTPDGDAVDDIAIVSVRLHRVSVVSTTIIRGRRTIARLRTVRMRTGTHTLRWGARSPNGTPVAAGDYRVRMHISEPRGRWRIEWATVRVASPAPPVPPASTVDPGAAPEALRWPLVGTVTSMFGMRDGRMHEGIDVVAAASTPVGAAAAGTVEFADWEDGYGLSIVLRHADGTAARYAHLSRIDVQVGTAVAAGQVVGAVGRTGNATTDHLHLELRDASGAAVDPLPKLPALVG